MSTTAPAAPARAAHQRRLAATMRAGLGHNRPDPARALAASLVADVRDALFPGVEVRGADVLDVATRSAAQMACAYLRRNDPRKAAQYADAEELLRDRAVRSRVLRTVRIGRELAVVVGLVEKAAA